MKLANLLELDAEVLLYALNLAMLSFLLCGFGLFLVLCLRRKALPLRRNSLVAVLILLLLSPVFLHISKVHDLGWTKLPAGLFAPTQSIGQPLTQTPLPFVLREVGDRRSKVFEADATGTVLAEQNLLVQAENSAPIRSHLERPYSAPRVDRQRSSVQFWGTSLVCIWVIGSLWNLLSLGMGFLRLRKARSQWTACRNEQVRASAKSAAQQVGLRKVPTLLQARDLPIPSVVGLHKPAIVVPRGISRGLDPACLHDVLVHEMAHIAHGDPWLFLGQKLVRAIFWWNPLAGLLNRRLSALREDLCDNHVLRRPASSFAFAQTLLNFARQSPTCPPSVSSLSLLTPKRGELERRIERLLDEPANLTTHMNLSSFLFIATLSLGLSGISIGAPLHLQADTQEPKATEQSNRAEQIENSELCILLTGHDGQPLPKQLLYSQSVLDGKLDGKPLNMRTDAKGMATFEDLSPGHYRIWSDNGAQAEVILNWRTRVEFNLVAPALQQPLKSSTESLPPVVEFRTSLENRQPVNIPVRTDVSESSILGRVINVEGRPISEAQIRVLFGKSGEVKDWTSVPSISTYSDEDGRFQIQSAWRGPVLMIADADGHVPLSLDLNLSNWKNNHIELALTMGHRIQGRVVNEKGEPVQNAQIRINGALLQGGQVRTDADGRFQMHGLAPGRYRLELHHPEYITWTGDTMAGTNQSYEIVVPLKTGPEQFEAAPAVRESARLIGQVLLPPDTLHLVRARLTQPAGHYSLSCRADDSTGKFDVSDLAPGQYEVRLLSGNAQQLLGTFYLHPGQTVDLGKIRWAPKMK